MSDCEEHQWVLLDDVYVCEVCFALDYEDEPLDVVEYMELLDEH